MRRPETALIAAPALTLVLLLGMAAGAVAGGEPQPVHALAMHGEPKYGPDFTHFDYVNPDAP